jgi:hypothetical protein
MEVDAAGTSSSAGNATSNGEDSASNATSAEVNASATTSSALADLERAEELIMVILDTANATCLELAKAPNCSGEVLKELVSKYNWFFVAYIAILSLANQCVG